MTKRASSRIHLRLEGANKSLCGKLLGHSESVSWSPGLSMDVSSCKVCRGAAERTEGRLDPEKPRKKPSSNSRPTGLFLKRTIPPGRMETIDEFFKRKGKITYLDPVEYTPPDTIPVRVSYRNTPIGGWGWS